MEDYTQRFNNYLNALEHLASLGILLVNEHKDTQPMNMAITNAIGAYFALEGRKYTKAHSELRLSTEGARDYALSLLEMGFESAAQEIRTVVMTGIDSILELDKTRLFHSPVPSLVSGISNTSNRLQEGWLLRR